MAGGALAVRPNSHHPPDVRARVAADDVGMSTFSVMATNLVKLLRRAERRGVAPAIRMRHDGE